MAYIYDDENIFAKILRGEIPNSTIVENEYALAFADINPAKKIHVLVIPKGKYVNYDDFLRHATAEEKAGFDALVLDVIDAQGLGSEDGERGYRAITNAGAWGHQEVPHYHVHILAGEATGPLVVK